MINLEQIKLIDLLPGVLKKDKTFKAICEVLQKYLDENNELANKMIILTNIDNIEDENIIDHLAYQFHVDFYDNEMNLKRKKSMIKNSIFNHRIKGTPKAVEDVLASVFEESNIKEWFEYEGDPYFFQVDVNISEKGINKNTLNRVETLIKTYKNKRSWLETLNLYLTSKANLYIGSCLISSEQITVYPYYPKELVSVAPLYVGKGSPQLIERVVVGPLEKGSENK